MLETIEALAPVIANLGFPIVVTLYLLIRVEKRLDAIGEDIREVTKSISKLL